MQIGLDRCSLQAHHPLNVHHAVARAMPQIIISGSYLTLSPKQSQTLKIPSLGPTEWCILSCFQRYCIKLQIVCRSGCWSLPSCKDFFASLGSPYSVMSIRTLQFVKRKCEQMKCARKFGLSLSQPQGSHNWKVERLSSPSSETDVEMGNIHTYVELSHRVELWKAGMEHAICNKPILMLSPAFHYTAWFK